MQSGLISPSDDYKPSPSDFTVIGNPDIYLSGETSSELSTPLEAKDGELSPVLSRGEISGIGPGPRRTLYPGRSEEDIGLAHGGIEISPLYGERAWDGEDNIRDEDR